jgi:hypothetical protein
MRRKGEIARQVSRGKRLLIAFGALMLAVAGTVIILKAAGAAAAPTPSLTTVDSFALSASGISLGPPEAAPGISEDEAHVLILQRYPNATISEMLLAQYHSRRIPAPSTLCWVASVAGVTRRLPIPPGMPPRVLSGPLVVAIDAQTGDLLETWQRSPVATPSP